MAVDQDLLDMVGGAPPATGSATGSQPQIKDATGTSKAVEADQAPKPPPVNLSGGSELLPRMDWAVKQQESGGHQIDPKTGTITTSPSGALGVSQLMPGTAAHLKVDPNDPVQNAEGGKRYLQEQYEKYGNWNDALMAYNWGPEHVDEWIKAGRPADMVPKETRQYVPAVLARLGMAPGEGFIAGRDGGDFMSDLVAHVSGTDVPSATDAAGSQDDAALVSSLIGANQNPVDMSSSGQDENMSLIIGARNGLRDVVAGPTQATLEQVSPNTAAAFTKYINDMDAPYARQREEHPYAYTMGNLIGTTVGMFTAAKLLGPIAAAIPMVRTMTMATRALPSVLKAMGIGYGIGATSFNKDPDSANRNAEGIIGATIGTLGHYAVTALGSVVNSVANADTVRDFVQLMQKNLKDMEPSLSGLKDTLIERYRTTLRVRDKLYGQRAGAGRNIEGYPSGVMVEGGKAQLEGVAQVVDDAINGKVGRDEATGLVRTTARELDRALGTQDQLRDLKVWEARQEAHAKEAAEWDKANGGYAPQIVPQLIEKGVIQPRPVAPEMFEPKPIPAERMAEGRRVLNRAVGRSRDVATRTQLNILKHSLQDTASATAKEAGVDVAEYERRQIVADKFNKDRVAPLQRILGFRTLQEAQEQLTPAAVHDRIVTAMKGTDRDAQEALHGALGSKGRIEARKAVLNDMMNKVIDRKGNLDSEKMATYLKANRSGLETVLGREEYGNLQGVAKVAGELIKEGKGPGGLRTLLAHHRWLWTYAGIKVMEGEFHEAAGLAGAAMAVEAVRAGLRAAQLTPRATVLWSRAKLDLSPAEMRKVMNSLDTVMGQITKTSSRAVPQATGGEPVTTGVDIAGQMGGAASSMFYQMTGQQ